MEPCSVLPAFIPPITPLYLSTSLKLRAQIIVALVVLSRFREV